VSRGGSAKKRFRTIEKARNRIEQQHCSQCIHIHVKSEEESKRKGIEGEEGSTL